jgi:hypothetical protein
MNVLRRAHGRRLAAGLLCLLMAAALVSFACTADFATQSEADVILTITKIIGNPGGGLEDGDFLLSDVTPIFNDNATLDFLSIPKNANDVVIGNFNDVFLERYEVRFFRTDGHNTEGVDVPYRFTGAMATMVPVNLPTSAAVIVVRHSAKEEPPLRNLAFLPQVNVNNGVGGGEGIIHAIAEITVHGRTISGRAVTATGRLSVTFADFADDSQSSPTPTPSASTLPSPVPSPSPTPKT